MQNLSCYDIIRSLINITLNQICKLCCLPIRGTASEVVGMISDTRFMKTVSDRRTVTSANWQTNVKMENSFISNGKVIILKVIIILILLE